MKKLILSLTFLFPMMLLAQMPSKVDWAFEAEKKEGQKYELQLKASIDQGWYIYSANLESDLGPVPTSIDFSSPENVTVIGKIKEEGKKIAGFDDIFQMNLIKYKDGVTFLQELEIPAGTKVIEGTVTFMTCNDKQCLPPRPTPFKIQL